ncbi:MAG: hypothetical protein M0Z95_13175 [Actinomycetota bacterium]|jgi:hypothetical protein|nr:hypothetical protein [Actinomycetota bacterium]
MTTEPRQTQFGAGFDQMGEHPLTVLVRPDTSGAVGLHDTLLSLAAQITQEFDVAILAAGWSDDHVRQLEGIVAGFDRSFAGRVRVVTDRDGSMANALVSIGRARSVSHRWATSPYVTVVTSPDVAFAHWTSSISSTIERRPGVLIHSVVASQPFEVARHGEHLTYTSVGRPRVPWPTQFDLVAFISNGPGTEPCSAFAIPVDTLSTLPEKIEGPSSLPDDERLWRIVSTIALRGEVVDVSEVLQLRRHSQEGSGHDYALSPSPISGSAAVSSYLRELDGRGLLGPGSSLHTLLVDGERGEEAECGRATATSTTASQGSTKHWGIRSLAGFMAWCRRTFRP